MKQDEANGSGKTKSAHLQMKGQFYRTSGDVRMGARVQDGSKLLGVDVAPGRFVLEFARLIFLLSLRLSEFLVPELVSMHVTIFRYLQVQ